MAEVSAKGSKVVIGSTEVRWGELRGVYHSNRTLYLILPHTSCSFGPSRPIAVTSSHTTTDDTRPPAMLDPSTYLTARTDRDTPMYSRAVVPCSTLPRMRLSA